MADCYAPEGDDLHRRWLPREIFADIGIADGAPPSAAAEDIAVHLTTGILGGEVAAPRLPPPPVTAPYHHHQQHTSQVCGLEGRVLVAYGGRSSGGVAPASWPFSPYSPLQWQVATNFVNGAGGVLGGPLMPAPPRPCHGPPPAKRRLGGTGVFLPRAEAYQYQHKQAATKPPAKVGKAALKGGPEKQQQQRSDQQWQQGETAAAETMTTTVQQQNASAALLALPQEWTY